MEPIVVNACVCCSSRLRIDLCSILDTLESAVCRTSGKRAFRATVKQNWCVKEITTNSLDLTPEALTILYVHVDSQEIGKTGQRTERTDTPTARQATADRQVDYKIYLGDNMYDQD